MSTIIAPSVSLCLKVVIAAPSMSLQCFKSLSIIKLSCSMQAGGIGCGIYTTNNPDACQYVADNCSANIIFAENKVQVEKILEVS